MGGAYEIRNVHYLKDSNFFLPITQIVRLLATKLNFCMHFCHEYIFIYTYKGTGAFCVYLDSQY